MEKQFQRKIIWTIKNLSSFLSETYYSDIFVVGGCKWRLYAFQTVFKTLSMCLEVPVRYENLPSGWRRNARYSITIVNQNPLKHFKQTDKWWFDANDPRRKCCAISMLTLNKMLAKDSGFLVDGELKIVAEIEVLEVIGKVDVSKPTLTILETIDANGFQLFPSQVEVVSHMFERHPDIASEFRPKNSNLRTGYMSLLLSLIETLRQSPQDILKADLAEAYAALTFMTDAGFKLDWLKKKLDEVADKKEKEEYGETRLQEIEEELKDLKLKCSDLESQLVKKKAEVSAAKEPVSFDDVI